MIADGLTTEALWKADAESNSVVVLKRAYLEIGGDLVVGSLLSQIVYWHRPDKRGNTKLRVMRNGKHWVAKTREGWMDECCITEAEFRRALRILKDQRIIETKVMKFSGIAMNHLRLNEERLLEELTALSPVSKQRKGSGEDTPIGLEESAQLDYANSSQPLTETTQERTTESISCAASSTCAKAANEELKTKNGQEREEGREEEEGKTEIIPNRDLGAFWDSLVASNYGPSPKRVTHKERGQLKKLKADLGEKHFYPVVKYAVENWSKFALEARCMAGLSAVPTDPVVGFLLKHETAAWRIWDKQVQSCARDRERSAIEQEPSVSWMRSHVQLLQRREDDQPHKASPEEIAAILARFR